MAMRRRNISARESLCKRFASQSAFVRHTGMASRFAGAPDLTGYGPRRFRMRMAAASTKASRFLFETISSGTGRDEVGAGYGVDYVSTRRVSSGDFPKLKDWPPLAEKEYDHWKRKVLSLATVMPALARILGSNPPDAPTMEALLRVYDLDAVYEAFMEGSYYVFPAEQADGFASSDERYGTDALSCQVFRKGAPAWDLSDAINEYEERKGMPAMEPSVRPVQPVGTPVSGVPSAAAAEAQSAPPRLTMQQNNMGAGAGQPTVPGMLNFGDLLSGTDSNVGSADTTLPIPPLASRGVMTVAFKEWVRTVLEQVAMHDVRLQYEARKREYDNVDRALIPLIVGALSDGQMSCLPGVDEMKSGRELWAAVCRYFEGTCESMSSLVQTLDAWTLEEFDDTMGTTAYENKMGMHLRMIKDSDRINEMTVQEFIEMLNMAIMLTRIGKSSKYEQVVAALRREDDLEMPRMRRVLREHERANDIVGGGASRSAVQSGFSSAMPEQVCKFHLTGHCKKGDSCRYAHPMGLSASEKARLIKEIEAKVKRAKERRQQKTARQEGKGDQEKGNAADVREEVERQLAAVKDQAEEEAIAAGFSCEVVVSEDEDGEKDDQANRIIEVPAPPGRFKYYMCPNCNVWVAPLSFCGRCRWVAPPPDKENAPPPNVEEDVVDENEIEDDQVECGYMMQCVEEEDDELKVGNDAVVQVSKRVIVDDVTGLIETDCEVESMTEYGEYGAEGRRLRPREERGIWSGVSDGLWEVRSMNDWFDDELLEVGQRQYWFTHLQSVLDWGGERAVYYELLRIVTDYRTTTEGQMTEANSLEEVDSVETVNDEEVSTVANSAVVPKVRASDFVFDTGATKHVTGDAESLDVVRVPEKVLKFKSASGDIKVAELQGVKGCVENIHVVEGWQNMVSVGKYCDETGNVVVLNNEGGYALPKGMGLAPIIQKYGVRVAQRNAKKGGMYRCTPALFEIGVSGGDQGCASEDAVAGDGETKVGASCVHEEVKIKVGAVPTNDEVETKVGDERILGDDEIEDCNEMVTENEENKNAQLEVQRKRELEAWVGGEDTQPATEDEWGQVLVAGSLDPDEHKLLVEEFLEAMEIGEVGEMEFWYDVVWEFDVMTIQETLKLVRMGDDPQEALAEVMCHTPQHMLPKEFQDPAGDKCRMEEEKVLYAIEMMEAMKKASLSGPWSSQESMSNAVCLTDLWGPEKTVTIGGYCYVRTKEDMDKMSPCYGCPMGANDVKLENEMPEKGGPDLPECQGGAG